MMISNHSLKLVCKPQKWFIVIWLRKRQQQGDNTDKSRCVKVQQSETVTQKERTLECLGSNYQHIQMSQQNSSCSSKDWFTDWAAPPHCLHMLILELTDALEHMERITYEPDVLAVHVYRSIICTMLMYLKSVAKMSWMFAVHIQTCKSNSKLQNFKSREGSSHGCFMHIARHISVDWWH